MYCFIIVKALQAVDPRVATAYWDYTLDDHLYQNDWRLSSPILTEDVCTVSHIPHNTNNFYFLLAFHPYYSRLWSSAVFFVDTNVQKFMSTAFCSGLGNTRSRQPRCQIPATKILSQAQQHTPSIMDILPTYRYVPLPRLPWRVHCFRNSLLTTQGYAWDSLIAGSRPQFRRQPSWAQFIRSCFYLSPSHLLYLTAQICEPFLGIITDAINNNPSPFVTRVDSICGLPSASKLPVWMPFTYISFDVERPMNFPSDIEREEITLKEINVHPYSVSDFFIFLFGNFFEGVQGAERCTGKKWSKRIHSSNRIYFPRYTSHAGNLFARWCKLRELRYAFVDDI